MDNWLLIVREQRDKELLCLHHVCGDLHGLLTLSCEDLISYRLKSDGNHMKGELPTFKRLFKVRRRTEG